VAKKKGPTPRRVERPRPRAVQKRWLPAALLAVSATAIAGVVLAVTRDGDDGNESAVGGSLATDPGPVHVHGIGINPADRALFIATHTGMYRAPAGSQQPARVGDSRQDTMGFTIVGPNRFLGSGHPDPETMGEQNLPPNLGLIESTDGGRTWTPISLFGEADFHVLRSRGRRVYGFDATNGRLLVSDDRGKTWEERPIPGALIDLAVNPERPAHIVAATGRGLITSADDGRSWRALSDHVGLLAWPAAGRLLLVDGAGRVQASQDTGRHWRSIGNVGGQPAAFAAESPNELYVALHDGTVKRSANGGAAWVVRSTP
jgi:hypothetical protein